jgi:glutamine amidotransferase
MSASTDGVVIVDYGAGNLTSVRLAVEKLGWRAIVTDEPEAVRRAERVVFPGVGAAGSAMETLRTTGLADALVEYAASGRPLAGICLGAQVIFERSAENRARCLGILPGTVERFGVGPGFKVPHMGWNGVEFVAAHPVWAGLESGSQFYFVHSFFPVPADPGMLIGRTDYGGAFPSAVARGNVVAFQFHPERSGRVGLAVLENFLLWRP